MPQTSASDGILAWLRAHREEMATLLERLVSAESPSLDPRTHEAALQMLVDELERLDFRVRRIRSPGASSEQLYARPRRRRRGDACQLLIGHVDTVWPVGTVAAMPVRREDGVLFGPGTADMKGGLVEMIFALRALRELGFEPVATPIVLVNGDEEIGSPDSTPTIRRLAQVSARAFVLESGEGPAGKLKIARKGTGRFTLTIHGRAAHAGAEPEHGVSAILELSHQVQKLFALNDPARGITVNVGTIDGGLRPNVVAPSAQAVIDVRVPSAAAARELEGSLLRLTPQLEGATIEIEGGFRRPPMEPLPRNRTLLASAVRLGAELGLTVEDAGLVGGASDANTTALYTGTLDGLGPIAEGSHATDERVDIDRLPERTALLALLLLEPLGHPRITTPGRPSSAHRSTSAPTVAVVGTAASETNLELVSAWRDLGIESVLVDAFEAAATLRPGDIVLARLDILPTLDGVEPGLLELLLLERRGLRIVNRAAALTRAHDKLLTASALQRAGLPHPRTEHITARRPQPKLEPPLVVKPRFGSWGVDVFRCNTAAELEQCLAEIRTRRWFLRHGALVQELVPLVGHDLRILVAGDAVIGAIRRVAAPGEWRTNISLGGRRESIVPPAAAAALAVAAVEAIGADFVGVDLLPEGDGYTVAELNGAVDFNATYSLPGDDVFRDAARQLALLVPASLEPAL